MSDATEKLGRAIGRHRPQRRISLPTIGQALYTDPNPDGSRKLCGNCWKWTRDNRCLEVEGQIVKTQVCGLHVYGPPQETWSDFGVELLPADHVGLMETPKGAGTSCATCKWSYVDHGGLWCEAIRNDLTNGPPEVHAYGCCARWEAKDAATSR